MKLPGRPKTVGQVISLPVGSILPSPHQPRRDFNMEELDVLSKSIAQNGLLSPITVRRDPTGGGRYFLIAGERRLLACRRLGWEEVPAIVSDAPEANAAVLTLIENLHRQDLNCFEEAEGIYALMKESGLSQQKICAMLAKPQPTVANKLRLLRLDPQVRQFLIDHGMGERMARALLALPGTDRQLKAARHILQNQMSARQAEGYIAMLTGRGAAGPWGTCGISGCFFPRWTRRWRRSSAAGSRWRHRRQKRRTLFATPSGCPRQRHPGGSGRPPRHRTGKGAAEEAVPARRPPAGRQHIRASHS